VGYAAQVGCEQPTWRLIALRHKSVAEGRRYTGPVMAKTVDLFRRSAGYVDRILRGEKPGDMAFQQPTKYELMINLEAAKGLGLELSSGSRAC